mmetsp:Transcript_11148/g.29014  ORF Transcript_11148/g.29014 Transcript_11148/m.29014 type:complete len:336 (+) Transcript_11148:23-1030(+)
MAGAALVAATMLALAPSSARPGSSAYRPRARTSVLASASPAAAAGFDVVIDVPSAEVATGALSPETVARATEAFREHGVVFLRDLLPLPLVEEFAALAGDNLNACRQQLKKQHGITEMDAAPFAFTEICHRSKGRFDMQLRPGIAPVPVTDALVQENAPWLPIVRALLGSSAKHMFTGAVVSAPGSEAQNAHMDGGHLFGLTDPDSLMCPAHCLNVFVPLVPVSMENGPTEFWPGTQQLNGARPTTDGPSIAPELGIGTIAMFDYRVLHRGLPNQSSSNRPVMYVTYARPWFSDVENFPPTRLFPGGAARTAEPKAKGFKASFKPNSASVKRKKK